MISYKIGKGSTLSIGKPAIQSEEMIKDLVAFFKRRDTVNSATLAWKVQNGEAGYLLVIDSVEKPQSIMPIIGNICQPQLGNYMLDVLYKDTALGRFVFDEVDAFYIKKLS